MAAKIAFTVTCEPGASAAKVAVKLRAAGLYVIDVLDEIGVINGHALPSAKGKLEKVKGVADVSPTLGFDIGPPDAPVS